MTVKRTKKARNPLNDASLELFPVEPLTANQALFFDHYMSNKSQLLLGYSGTGKTYIAMYKAFQEMQKKNSPYKRIVLVRSAVPTRDIGFLKGTEAEKGSVYELPYKKVCSQLFHRDDAYEVLVKHDGIRFMLTSFIRGLTIDNSIVIVDEFQNMTAHEADSVLTRVGGNCKIIICGDILQRDFTKPSERNIEKFLQVVESMPKRFDFNYFNEEDIVRSGLVGDYIRTKHKKFPSGFE
jgi:phosphate starvation-inducible protein PhoH|tara:strand:+ start:492 stop:1205 length:714 start_codon:yes stop_codon:yes gene_type:complete